MTKVVYYYTAYAIIPNSLARETIVGEWKMIYEKWSRSRPCLLNANYVRQCAQSILTEGKLKRSAIVAAGDEPSRDNKGSCRINNVL